MEVSESLVVLNRVLNRFKEVLDRLKNLQQCESRYETYRDSTLKRFELSMIVFLRTLKDILLIRFGIEVGSPKSAALVVLENGLIDKEEYNKFIDMIDDWHRISYAYEEEYAEDICSRAHAHYEFMQKITTRF